MSVRRENNKDIMMKDKRKKRLLYYIWKDMKSRCLNPKDKSYKYYGSRGIKVCEEWKNNMANFIEWALENGWKKGLTIDRKNNDGNYEPKNCSFVTRLQQMNNTRRAKLFIAYGPCGQIEIAKNQSLFARKWNLTASNICSCLSNNLEQTKGWFFEFLNPVIL